MSRACRSGVALAIFVTVCLPSLTAAAPPGAPTRLSFLVQGSLVTLQWTPAASGGTPTSYVIEAGSVAGAANLANFNTGNAFTAYFARDVPPGSYYIRVRALNGDGVSGPSNEILAVVSTCAPPAPTVLTLFSGHSSTVSLAWAFRAGGGHYILEAGSLPGLTDLAVLDVGNRTSFSASGIAPGAYFVRVRERGACGDSPPSDEVDVIVGAGNSQSLVRTRFSPNPALTGGSPLVTPACPSSMPTPRWFTQVTFEELFGPGFTVSSWQINSYDVAGTIIGSTPYTAGDFASFFRATGAYVPGASVVQYDPNNPNAGSTAPSGFVCFHLAGRSTGSASIAISGTDDRGHALTFTSSSLTLR